MSSFRLSKRLTIALLSMVLLALSLSSVALPVRAWSPATHLQTGNNAISEILAGSNTVTIDGRQYSVDHRVADAIRSFPEFYRGGVVGPDAFPDIYVGQEFIHPDNQCNMGLDLSCPGLAVPSLTNLCSPGQCAGTFSYKWLRHVFDSGWDYYKSHNGDDLGKQALAFTYGYLTHAAGDMWGHTLINEFSGGTFEDGSFANGFAPAINHIIVESYVKLHTPDTNLTLDSPSDFIFRTFISDSFRDGAQETSKSLGRGVFFEYFFNLKDRLVAKSAEFAAEAAACGNFDPSCLTNSLLVSALLAVVCDGLVFQCIQGALLGLKAYVDAWIQDIDAGLRAWPTMSEEIAEALFAQREANVTAAGDAVHEFVVNHLLAMLGGGIGVVVSAIIKLADFIADTLGPLVQPLKNAIHKFQNWVIQMLTGIDLDALKEFFSHPYNFINGGDFTIGSTTYHIGLPANTSQKLDSLMCITDGIHNLTATFDPNCFEADHDTVVMAKLLLLNATSLNHLLQDHRVGPLYSDTGPDEGNAMLGFIRSLDGSQAWRKTSTQPAILGRSFGEGMPLWTDCSARIHVFRVIFTDWPKPWNTGAGNPNFPDEGDPCVVVQKFFTNGLNPLPLDSSGNPIVAVVLANGRVRSTNPGEIVAWVNVTNGGTVPLQSLRLTETLPVDWTVHPAWTPFIGSIHVFFVFANGTRLDITNSTTISVNSGNPQSASLSIASMSSTLADKVLGQGESILLSVRLNYGLTGTTQSVLSYPRNYADTATVSAWTNTSYLGKDSQAKVRAFFIAVAKIGGL